MKFGRDPPNRWLVSTQVWIRGPTVFSGYVGGAAPDAFAGTWFRTGDLATVDGRGYLTITDRAKDMILVGSENVYCVEVERALHDHPSVTHAAVYGLPDGALGERVKAVVVADGAVAADDLRRHCATLLADFKVPSRVEFLDALPLTGSGKVAKAALKAGDGARARAAAAARDAADLGAGKESDIPNFKGSDLGHFPLVSADFWTSDHLSERSRSVDAFFGTRARGTLTLKRT